VSIVVLSLLPPSPLLSHKGDLEVGHPVCQCPLIRSQLGKKSPVREGSSRSLRSSDALIASVCLVSLKVPSKDVMTAMHDVLTAAKGRGEGKILKNTSSISPVHKPKN
jgi:hypothetical protein